MFALSVAWIDGTDPDTGMSFNLTSGAGVGSPLLRLSVKLPSGEIIREAIDIRDGMEAWVKQIVAEHSSEA